MRLRITVHGYKGGIGKSTVSLILAKALAISGKRVIFVDRDLFPYSSSVAGIEADGLLVQLMKGEEPKGFYRDFTFGKGKLKVIKLYSPELRFTIHKVTEEIESKFVDFYANLLDSEDFDYIIIDSPSPPSWNSKEIFLEVKGYLKTREHQGPLEVLIAPPTRFDIESSIAYMKKIEQEATETLKHAPRHKMFAGLINMVTESKEKYVDDLKYFMKELSLRKGVIIKFYDELFLKLIKLEELPIIPEIKALADRLVSGDIESEEIIL